MQHYRKLLAAAMLMMTGSSINAQDRTQGEITYTIRIPMGDRMKFSQPELAGVFPEVLEREAVLIYRDKQALINTATQQEITSDDGNVKLMISSGGDEAQAYLNMNTKRLSYLVNLQGKISI
ncbi:hypothetical protein MKQ68_10050 [Chitinophaga horti]|uniref:Uncharacterized protein n=1 Tax=Chitinophaga horti TaxID=2920382 RepID=A0ABY6J7H7_9BACT|nr:hypothetical protein [Chitinophaga horti]UYQ95440.1 hypothetical protein MKQ68_10050 [Chitinophaga horti]